MKLNVKKTMAGVLTAALLCTGAFALSANQAASGLSHTPDTDQAQAAAPEQTAGLAVQSQATITSLDIDGEYPSITVELAAQGEKKGETIQLNLSEDTVILDTQSGLAVPLTGLKAGDEIYAYYSAASTRSIPAQSAAFALVTNLDGQRAPAHYLTAEEVTANEDGSVTILAESGSILVTIAADTPISPYQSKNVVKNTDITTGSRLFAWYDTVALSMPGQAHADKAVLIPDVQEPAEAPLPEFPIAISEDRSDASSDGLTIGVYAVPETQYAGDVMMVPLRAVAEANGFTVQWNQEQRSIRLTNGTVETTVTIGQDSYFKSAAKESGVLGLTQSKPLGAAPYEVDGTTWVPASLFNLLGLESTME